MPMTFIRNLKECAGRMAYKSALYNWSLSSEPPPELLFKPVDPWPGDTLRAQKLLRGTFELSGEDYAAQGAFWHAEEMGALWMDHLHKFTWLRDLRTLGGTEGRYGARAYIEEWIKHFHYWDEAAWAAPRLGRRISLWLSMFDFYGESADEGFQAVILESVQRQARHLYRAMPLTDHGIEALEALQGLIYAGLALPGGERMLDYGLEAIAYESEHQILGDGGYISRNPHDLLQAVIILSDIRGALLGAGYPIPVQLQHALDHAIPALRFFRMPDNGFCLAQGTQEGKDSVLEKVILQSGIKGKIARSMKQSGFERMNAGRTLILVDTGNAPHAPYDRGAHAATGAFELTIGRERVFVNCGTHPLSAEWRDMLRGSAAHNTLTIDHRNIFEICQDGHIGRKPKKVEVNCEEIGGGQLLTVKHDGYVPLNGVVHKRRIFMDAYGVDIRGEEELCAKTGTLTRPVHINVRFHLHPRVSVSLIREGKEALLLLPGGSGWRFNMEGATLALENSVYLGEGTYPRKTKQIVLSALMEDPEMMIQWALQRESH